MAVTNFVLKNLESIGIPEKVKVISRAIKYILFESNLNCVNKVFNMK